MCELLPMGHWLGKLLHNVDLLPSPSISPLRTCLEWPADETHLANSLGADYVSEPNKDQNLPPSQLSPMISLTRGLMSYINAYYLQPQALGWFVMWAKCVNR